MALPHDIGSFESQPELTMGHHYYSFTFVCCSKILFYKLNSYTLVLLLIDLRILTIHINIVMSLSSCWKMSNRGVNVYLIIGHGIVTISSITYDIQVMNYFNYLRGSQIYHVECIIEEFTVTVESLFICRTGQNNCQQLLHTCINV